jgi:hypothetical protein
VPGIATRVLRAACIVACCAAAQNAIGQTAELSLDQTIDADLQAQAQSEMDKGHDDQALALLNELVKRDPHQAGALLDAAMLYCRLGERDLSLRTLTRIESQYKVPPAIEKLISIYRTNTCTPSTSRPMLRVSAGAGVTSNANFGPSDPFVTFAPGAPIGAYELAPESLAHHDQYIESALQGELPVSIWPGITLLGSLTDRQYRSVHAFDQRTATLGIADQKRFSAGEFDSQITADQLWLGTSVYQRDFEWHSAYWTRPRTVGSALARAGLDFTLTDSAYPGNSLYDSVHAEVRAAFQAHVGERTTMLLFVGPGWDRPQGNRPGGMRHGYAAWLSLDYDAGRRGQFEAIFQQSTLNDTAPYDPIFFGNTAQRQTVTAASLRYSYPLTRGWSLYAQVSDQRISDSISLFSYTVRDGSLGVSWKY